MASEQMMNEAVARAVAEATRIALQKMAEAQTERTQNAAGPKLGSPTLKQPSFDWEVLDKHTELKHSTYNTPEAEKLAVVNNWLGRKGLHYLETLTPAEGEACNMVEGLFDTLANKFKPQ